VTAGGVSRMATERWAAVLAALAPLGSVSALSDRVWLVFVPLGVIAQLTEAATFGTSPTAWALVGIVATLVMGIGFRIARRVVRHIPAPGPLRILAVLLVLGSVRSTAVDVAAVGLDLRDPAGVLYRLAAPIFNLAMLAVIAYAVSRYDSHRAVVAELEATRLRLLDLERTTDVQRIRTEAELAGAVRATVDPALASLDAALVEVAAGSTAGPVLRDLERLIETEIRPLSHRLATDEAEVADPVGAGDDGVLAPVPLPARFPIGDGIRPAVAAALFVAALIPTALRDLPPTDTATYLAAAVVYTLATLSVIRRLIGRFELPIPVVVLVVVAIHLVLGRLTVPAIAAVGIATPVGIALGTGGVMALIGAMTVGTALVDARRAASEAARLEAIARLQASVALIRRHRQLARRRLAYALHGGLQGALHAAAVRLTEASVVDAAIVDAIRADIAAAAARIAGSRPDNGPGRTRRTIDELVTVWQDERTIRVALDPAAEVVLVRDPDADEAMAEVLREAVNNALRHGGASVVDVRIAPADPGTLAIEVRDDGRGWPSDAPPGAGCRLFDELCRTWTHGDGAPGTVVRATVAAD